jgi:hypothetical protein
MQCISVLFMVVIAALGDNVTLTCPYPETDITWLYYKSLDIPVEDWIYVDNGLVGKYRVSGRFHVSKDYSLTITDYLHNDSGVYACVEQTGFGDKHFVELTTVNGTYLLVATLVVSAVTNIVSITLVVCTACDVLYILELEGKTTSDMLEVDDVTMSTTGQDPSIG